MEEKDNKKTGSVIKKKPVKTLLTIILLLAILAASAFIVIKKNDLLGAFNQRTAAQQRTAVVDKGSIEEIVEGSGAVQSATRKEVAPKVVSTVEAIYFKVGDVVKKGDLMFELDDTDALLDIQDIKNNIGQAKLNMQDTVQGLDDLTVKAPISGLVTGISVEAGDTVSRGSSLMTITDTSKIKVVLPFGGEISGLTAGREAEVVFADLMTSIKGKVTYVSNKPYSLDGVLVRDVEITVENPGALTADVTVGANISVNGTTYSSVEDGTTEYISTKAVSNDSGGKISALNVKLNQSVNAGDVLAELGNESLSLSLNTEKLKLETLESQLAIKESQLEYYKLTAPSNGTIISQEVSIGDTVSAGNALAAVADMDALEFDINVDELDISNIKVGQEVTVTADAVADTLKNPLKGTVGEIPMEGTSSNGVTTYAITVSLEKSDKLKTGMNVNGEITVMSKKNVLRVPVEAVKTIDDSTYVYVQGGTDPSGNNPEQKTQQGRRDVAGSSPSMPGDILDKNSDMYYSNARLVKVETGISNDTYTEIISGLTEGQVVILPETGTDSEEESGNGQQSGIPGGMIGGEGPPQGGSGGGPRF